MSTLRRHLERLAAAERWTYRAGVQSAAEPAAWAAVALAAHGQAQAAARPAQWLAAMQQQDGSIGVSVAEPDPRWPTPLAMLAWQVVDDATGRGEFRQHIERAAKWSLSAHGKTGPRSPHIGHDTTLVGWSWAADTASWLEPTCFFVLGLRAAGLGDHARVREGVALVRDRMLPDGGANYGNTIVLGQQLLPHVAPTGLAITVLAGQSPVDSRLEKSLAYLEQAVGPETSPASLSWACIGLASHNRRPHESDAWIETALESPTWRPVATYESSLLMIAASPALPFPEQSSGI